MALDELAHPKNKDVVLIGQGALQLDTINESDFDPRSEESMKGFLDEMKQKNINHDVKMVCVGADVRELCR